MGRADRARRRPLTDGHTAMKPRSSLGRGFSSAPPPPPAAGMIGGGAISLSASFSGARLGADDGLFEFGDSAERRVNLLPDGCPVEDTGCAGSCIGQSRAFQEPGFELVFEGDQAGGGVVRRWGIRGGHSRRNAASTGAALSIQASGNQAQHVVLGSAEERARWSVPFANITSLFLQCFLASSMGSDLSRSSRELGRFDAPAVVNREHSGPTNGRLIAPESPTPKTGDNSRP